MLVPQLDLGEPMRQLCILVPLIAGCAQSAEYAPEPDVPATEASVTETPRSGDTLDAVGSVAGLVEVFMESDAVNMGLDPDDPDYDDYHYVQTVELSSDWAIGQTEVTHEMWESLMPYALRGMEGAPVLLGDCDACPANNVSWHEAHAFANALSAAEGLEQCFSCEGEGQAVHCTPVVDPYSCTGYRLPTEAEWEYAARGGEDLTYPGSDDIDEIAYWRENSGDRAYPVASKAPNGYGLYDMGGNIRERVYDAYQPYAGGELIDPVVMPDLDNPNEVFSERGGSFACERAEIRWNRRNLVWDYARDIHTGFRVARTLR